MRIAARSGVGEPADPANERAVAFGRFTLVPARRLLLMDDATVPLGSRAMELLIALVARAGTVVGKDDLVRQAWPDTHVEEGNLRVHIAALRRALGDGQDGARFIATIPGRGYSFVAPVVEQQARRAGAEAELASDRKQPRRTTRRAGTVIGRQDVIETIVAQMPARRFITLVGPGGIGKTTVALAAVDQLAPDYADGTRFVDLAPVSDPLLVPSILAAALGVAVRSDNAIPGILAFLGDKTMLIVIDNCEHVVDAAASLAESLFDGAPTVHILATSREPLRVEGERVVRLTSLAVPEASAGLTAAEALTFPAIQLFVERAAATLDTFVLTDADAPIVADICRRLDGIALAIEFAAGRVDAFGVAGLAEVLNDRFSVLTSGRRTALPRHQTLHAMFDWSYGLLPEAERTVLRRLAILAGLTALHYANEVVAGGSIATAEVPGLIANLVAKSLVVADSGGKTTQYRLLDTTRAYAAERLAERGERESLARHHAECYRRFSAHAAAEWEMQPTDAWLDTYAPCLDNLRIALDWAFSPNGDPAIGRDIVVAATLIWFPLSLTGECRTRVEQAMASLDASPETPDRDTPIRMKLHAALAWSLMYSTDRAREADSHWTRALELAESLDDVDYSMRSLWGLWAGTINGGRFGEALDLAIRFSELTQRTGDEGEALVGERMMAVSRHFMGDFSAAQDHIGKVLARYVAPPHRSHTVRFQFEQRITAGITLGRVLLFRGFPEQALAAIETSISDAVDLDHTLTLCNALAQAVPVAVLAGDVATAERLNALLLRHTATHALDVWHDYGRCFQAQVAIQKGERAEGLRMLGASINRLRGSGFVQYLTVFLAAYADALAAAGNGREAREVIDEALERIALTDERLGLPELWRVDGVVALAGREPEAATRAEAAFRQSLALAGEQGALFWQLRTATDLAALLSATERPEEARTLLADIAGRFTEGFGTPDFLKARAILDSLDA